MPSIRDNRDLHQSSYRFSALILYLLIRIRLAIPILLIFCVATTYWISSKLFDERGLQSRSVKIEIDAIGTLIAERHGAYFVLKDYVHSDSMPKNRNASVTMATHATPDYLPHLIPLSERWHDGYVSIAVYAPGEDFARTLAIIKSMRRCYSAIRHRVTWHIVFDSEHMPSSNPELISITNCSSPKESFSQPPIEYRRTHSLTYPINLMRNIARSASQTEFVLVNDIELYPSAGIVRAFLKFIQELSSSSSSSSLDHHHHRMVFVLPIFEVAKNVTNPPRTKRELVRLFRAGEAIFFHRHICDECQAFVNRSVWIQQQQQQPENDNDEQDLKLQIFAITTRDRSYAKNWEPLFIGTDRDPRYDEHMSWEGKRDKMSQALEMCLADYRFAILDNAFLVHSPGIKFRSPADDDAEELDDPDQDHQEMKIAKKRLLRRRLIIENRRRYELIERQLRRAYWRKTFWFGEDRC